MSKSITPQYEVSKKRIMVVAKNLSEEESVHKMIPVASLAIMLIHSIGDGKFTTEQAFDALTELAKEQEADCG